MKSIIFCICMIFFSCLVTVPGQDLHPAPPSCEILKTGLILNNQPFPQCHASTLVELRDGSILVAFFGGSHESAPDVKIWSVIFKNDRWTEAVILADGRMNDTVSFPCWNPVLFKSGAGRLYLFYKVGKNPREWFGMMKFSDDDGLTWSESSRLPDGYLGPVKNKPAELQDLRLLCPSSTETTTEWKVQMEIYDPAENRWIISKVDQDSPFQVIQPTILQYKDSTFRILCRSKSNAVVTAVTHDNGRSWSGLSTLNLPNPNSGIDGITLNAESHLLVYNPLVRGEDWSNGRNQLNLAWSPDGLTWTDLLILEKEKSGEFSYPAIIQSSDGIIHLTYTHNRTQIKYWKIKVQEK